MTTRRSARVLVLGAGVSGLSCASLLLEHGHEVEIWAREAPLATTSAIAAALWSPFEAGPPERVADWAVRSLARFRSLAERPETGIREVPLVDLRSPAHALPEWVRALAGFRVLAGAELRGFEQGWRARAPVIEMPLYLPWLAEEVQRCGARFTVRAVTSLEETRGFDGVVNCTGLGAAELCADRECFPIRGQIARVPRGEVSGALVFQRADGSFGYVVPRAQDCVLGGTAERGATSLAPDPAATERILYACRELEPRCVQRPLSVAVGLRPGRSAIRLERERLPDGRALVHDYGHGGCGVTLSWACAQDARALLEQALA